MHYYPDYYFDFKCIASKCRHNCCIGWEIDIDDNTLSLYKNIEGEFSKRFKDSISFKQTPHFVLDKNERCPFLNDKNLCDIICTLGEDYLCDICAQHPRFHNELPNRIESGLGLCCEQACKMILSKKEKLTFVCEKDCKTDDEIILLRDKVISLLQNREKSINERISDMLSLCDAKPADYSIERWCNLLLSLECMDEKWTEIIKKTKENYHNADLKAFDEYMQNRQHEYEQFAVYLIYRHFANSPDLSQAKKRACFTKFSYEMLYAIGAVIFSTTNEFDFETQVEIARLFSSEIEYSDENIYAIYAIF